MDTVKALFYCSGKFHTPGSGTNLSFQATQGQSGEESKAFHDATPSGSLSLHIADGKPAANYFEQGGEYYLTFEKKAK